MATVARKPRIRRSTSQVLRRIVQWSFGALILVAAWRHSTSEEAGLASLDALCPFGGLETMWRMLVDGAYVPKTHPSNIVLGAGLLVGVLLAGAAFCGWICPFGSLQDGLTWVREKLRLREVRVPAKVDRWLRYGRFVILGLILYQTISTVKLWFAGYDPYRTIFGLGWLFFMGLFAIGFSLRYKPIMEQFAPSYVVWAVLITFTYSPVAARAAVSRG